MKLSSIVVDAAAIEAGVWVGNLPFLDPRVRVLVRGDNAYAVAAARVAKARAAAPDAATLEEALAALVGAAADRAEAEILAEAVLLDWEGIEDDDGRPVPYDPAKAADLFANPDWRLLTGAVRYASREAARTRPNAAEALAKN